MSYRKDTATKKRLLVSLTTTILLFSSHTFANKYIDSAERYLSKNEINAAIIELKNAIQKSPEEALPRYMLGKVYLEQGDFSNAEKELSRAIKYGYNSEEALPLLALSLLNQNKLNDIQELVEDFSQTHAKPIEDLIAIQAIAEIRLSNREKAGELLAKVGHNSVYTRLAHANYLSANNQTELALTDVDELLKTESTNSDIWLLRGHLKQAQKEFGDAYLSYEKAYQLSPGANQYRFFMANALVNDQKLEKAKPVIDDLLTTYSQNAYLNELKAIIAYSEEDFSLAKTHADRALQNGLNSLRAATISGISAFRLEQYEQAYRVLNKVSSQLPQNHIANRINMISQIKLGYTDDAIKALNSYKIQSKEDSLFLSQASLELAKMGRNESALQLAQKASLNDNQHTEAALGLVKLANNDTSGLEELNSAIELDPTLTTAKQTLANYYLSNKMFDDAESIADEWLEKQPDDVTALLVKGIARKQKGNTELAEQHFNHIRKLEPNNIQAIVELASIEAEKENSSKALNLLLEAKKIAPHNNRVNARFLTYSKRFNRLPEAIKTLDEQIKAEPLNSNLKVQKAYALVLNEDKKSAINLLESIPYANRNISISKFLGDLYLSEKDISEAKNNYKRWLDADTYNPTAYIQNIRLLEYSKDLIESLKVTEKALDLFPTDTRFTLIKTELLIKRKKLSDAQETLNTLPEQIRNTTYALQLQGILYVAQQDFSSAIEVYKNSYEIQPNQQNARTLASVYVLNKQQKEAIKFLKEAISNHSDDPVQLQLKLAELQIKSQPEKALEQYKLLLSANPNNAIALNNIAWIYLDQEQPNKACDFAQKAYEIANKSYEIVDTYGYCLLKSGDSSKAVELLELAYNSQHDSTEIALHFAEALVLERRREQAIEVLSDITTKDPYFIALKSRLDEQVKLLTP